MPHPILFNSVKLLAIEAPTEDPINGLNKIWKHTHFVYYFMYVVIFSTVKYLFGNFSAIIIF